MMRTESSAVTHLIAQTQTRELLPDPSDRLLFRSRDGRTRWSTPVPVARPPTAATEPTRVRRKRRWPKVAVMIAIGLFGPAAAGYFAFEDELRAPAAAIVMPPPTAPAPV